MHGEGYSMTVDQVSEIASKYVTEQRLDECELVSITRNSSAETGHLATQVDEWFVQFRFIDEVDSSSIYICVVVDDTTGVPEILESL